MSADLGESIWQDIQSLISKSTEEYRARSDANVHCMDVGIAALKASDPTIDYRLKNRLHTLFRKEFFNSNSLESAILHARDEDNIDRSLFVEDPVWGEYIVGPSYSALQRRVSRILKASTVESAFTGTDALGRTTTNIGHLSLKDTDPATTPLEAKLSTILAALSADPVAGRFVNRKIAELHRYHRVDTAYVFNRKNFDLKEFSRILGTGTVLVTLQTAEKNAKLARLEADIERKVRDYLSSDKFRNKILEVKGSNSILEDIIGAFIAGISGKTTVPGSLHKPKVPKTSSSALLNKKQVTLTRPAKLRTVRGQFYSLASLQRLLDASLVQKIKDNMGDGRRRDVLNLRSGRFAESARVERLSQSREGMITAFYTYMKNPYQTFEPGFKQGSPSSRNPRLLISKSIREIAATQVANRMRAVLV